MTGPRVMVLGHCQHGANTCTDCGYYAGRHSPTLRGIPSIQSQDDYTDRDLNEDLDREEGWTDDHGYM